MTEADETSDTIPATTEFADSPSVNANVNPSLEPTPTKRRKRMARKKATPPALRGHKSHMLSEADILDRIEALQRCLNLPCEVWSVMLDVLCPESVEEPPLPAEATATLPGTAARLAVMEERAERGESPWHPGDAGWDDAEALHLEQIGAYSRSGAVDRLSCETRIRSGAQSTVDIGRDPEKAAEIIRENYQGEALTWLAGLLWEGCAYHGRKPQERTTPDPLPAAPVVDPRAARREGHIAAVAAISPNLGQLVIAGEMTLARAQVLAGLKEERVSIPTRRPDRAAVILRRHFDPAGLATLAGLLAVGLGSGPTCGPEPRLRIVEEEERPERGGCVGA